MRSGCCRWPSRHLMKTYYRGVQFRDTEYHPTCVSCMFDVDTRFLKSIQIQRQKFETGSWLHADQRSWATASLGRSRLKRNHCTFQLSFNKSCRPGRRFIPRILRQSCRWILRGRSWQQSSWIPTGNTATKNIFSHQSEIYLTPHNPTISFTLIFSPGGPWKIVSLNPNLLTLLYTGVCYTWRWHGCHHPVFPISSSFTMIRSHRLGDSMGVKGALLMLRVPNY